MGRKATVIDPVNPPLATARVTILFAAPALSTPTLRCEVGAWVPSLATVSHLQTPLPGTIGDPDNVSGVARRTRLVPTLAAIAAVAFFVAGVVVWRMTPGRVHLGGHGPTLFYVAPPHRLHPLTG